MSGISYAIFDATIFVDKYSILQYIDDSILDDRIFYDTIFDNKIFDDKTFDDRILDDQICDDTILIDLLPRYPSAAHSLLVQVFRNILKEGTH